MPTALSLLGKKFPNNRTLNEQLKNKSGWESIKKTKISKVIVLVIDALGFNEFQKFSKLFKDKFDSNGIAISSVFPTITSTCMATIHHGLMPIEHGLVGQKIFFKEIGNVVDTLTLKTKDTRLGNLTSAGVKVESWLWNDYILSKDDDILKIDLIESHVANVGLSNFLHEELNAVGYSSFVDCFAAVKRILERNKDNKVLLNIYIGSIDHISHRYTPESQEFKDELQNIEKLFVTMLKRLQPEISTETAIFITADHGQEAINEESRIVISEEEENYLQEIIKARGRSGRVIHLYSKEGKREEVINFFTKKIKNQGVIITPEDYPIFMGMDADNDRVVSRLGDVQIILGKNAQLFFGHTGDYDPEYNLGLNATHGSLSRDELVVPLIIGLCNDFIE